MEGRETEEDENETHKLGRSDSSEWRILNTVLLHLARGWLPPHVEAVGGGTVNLDVPGWSTRNCRGGTTQKAIYTTSVIIHKDNQSKLGN